MKLLVTGGCGFLGSHFVRAWLTRYPDDTITNVDCLTYAGSAENLGEFRTDSRYRHHKVDIADSPSLNAIWEGGYDLMVHFAAESHVDRSLEDSSRFVRTNVLGTHNLLERIRSDHTPAILISSDEVYGPTPKGAQFGVGEPLRPTSPYAASKAAADWLSLAYRHTHDCDIAIIRSVNVYGPRQFPEKFIPLAIVRALDDKQIPLYGHGRQRRCWLYVDDFVDGVIAIARDAANCRAKLVWHLGSVDELENVRIAQMICALCNRDSAIIAHVSDRPGHDQRYALDFSQTARVFGWKPLVPFADGLKKTIDWYRDNPRWLEERPGWTPQFLRMT